VKHSNQNNILAFYKNNMIHKASKIYSRSQWYGGSAIWRNLVNKGYTNLRGIEQKLDLRNQTAVDAFMLQTKYIMMLQSRRHIG
jgi:GDP-L-fucose synthase